MSASPRAGEPLGSAAEEAGRLADALHEWWGRRETAAAAPDGSSEPAAEARPDEHQGGGACRYCPLCRGAAVVQSLRPEVVQHLLTAAEAVAAALREVAATPSPAPDAAAGRPHPGRRDEPAAHRRTVRIPVADGDHDGQQDGNQAGDLAGDDGQEGR